MLSINKWFRVTTYPENDERLSEAIELFNVVVESERYIYANEKFDWSITGPTRFILECHIDADEFDGFVEYLNEVFADTWATITH